MSPAHKEFVKKNFTKLASIPDAAASEESFKSSAKAKKLRHKNVITQFDCQQLSVLQRRKLKNCLPPAKGQPEPPMDQRVNGFL